MSENLRSIVFDVDDTISFRLSDDAPRGDELPNLYLINIIRELHSKGWEIILHTARGWARPGGIARHGEAVMKEVEEFCLKHQIPFSEIQVGKPPAVYYVDDRGMHWQDFINHYNENNEEFSDPGSRKE